MSRSFLFDLSFNFNHSCQPDYRHVLSRSLARHFFGQNLARVSLRIFVRELHSLPENLRIEPTLTGFKCLVKTVPFQV